MNRRTVAALLSCLVLGGCTGQDATTRLAQDLPNVENIERVHARFPCFSPDFHLYGYRFRVQAKKPEKWELRRHLLEFCYATMDLGDAARI